MPVADSAQDHVQPKMDFEPNSSRAFLLSIDQKCGAGFLSGDSARAEATEPVKKPALQRTDDYWKTLMLIRRHCY